MRKSVNDPDARHFCVLDVDRDVRLQNCTFVDEEAGEYHVLGLHDGREVVMVMWGNIKLLDKRIKAHKFKADSCGWEVIK